MEPATRCLEGMFSTAQRLEDGTSNTLFRRHVLNCSRGWNQQHIVLEGMFSAAVEDGTSNTLFRRHVLNCTKTGGWNQQHIV